MDLKSISRSTTIEGVTLWMIPYHTALVKRILNNLGDAFPKGAPFAMNVYGLCAPLTVAVDLPPDNPPEWAVLIKQFIADKSFFLNPIERAFELEQVATDELFRLWWQAYNETRHQELLASEQLRSGDEAQTGENPTSAAGES